MNVQMLYRGYVESIIKYTWHIRDITFIQLWLRSLYAK